MRALRWLWRYQFHWLLIGFLLASIVLACSDFTSPPSCRWVYTGWTFQLAAGQDTTYMTPTDSAWRCKEFAR